MKDLAYPVLTLYAFQLWKNLAQGRSQLESAGDLWQKTVELGEKLQCPELKQLPDKIGADSNQVTGYNLISGCLKFTSDESENNFLLTGEANPLKINNTYFLDLTLRYAYPEVSFTDLRGLNPENCLLPNNIQADLGQTLIFFAKPLVEFEHDEQLKAFADKCLENLLSAATVQELNITLQNQGKLLKSPIFEYSNETDDPQQQCHILVWLNTHTETGELEKSGEYYYPLIDLLLHYHKTIYVRNQATLCNQAAREKYTELENKVTKFNQQVIPNSVVGSITPASSNQITTELTTENLTQLKQWLTEIPGNSFNYSCHIRDLQIHKTTIETNIKNYKLNLDKLEKTDPENDLTFLSEFLTLAEETFLEQIDLDITYLTPAENLVNRMLETIRGLVEIEQTKRDRSLEKTVQIVGVALGGGAIVSGVVTSHIDKPIVWRLNPKLPLHPLFSSLLWSILATLMFGWLAWLWTKRKGNS